MVAERYTDIADDLISVINKSELSVCEISRLSGVPVSTIFGWLNASKTPSFRNAFYVYSALGYTLTLKKKEEEQ